MSNTPIGWTGVKAILKQVEYKVVVDSVKGVGIVMIDKGLATLNLSKNITPAAGQANTNPAKAELENWKKVASVCDGLGNATTLAKGLPKGVEIVSKLNAKKIIGVGITRRQTATKKARDLGPDFASLTQGLATKLRLGLDNNEVFVTELINMNCMIGFPKNYKFQIKKKY